MSNMISPLASETCGSYCTNIFFKLILRINILRNSYEMGLTWEPHHSCWWWVNIWVNIGSGNGLLPDGTKPWPEPMFTQICHHMASLGHNELILYAARGKISKTGMPAGPDSKVHGANMGPSWVLSAPDRPHVGPLNLAIRGMPAACRHCMPAGLILT